MSIFQYSSVYYDIFYKTKPYQEEVEKISELISAYIPNKKNILDLGCGTGEHSIRLSKKGFNVTGVDASSEMLRVATNKAKKNNVTMKFLKEDIRNLNLSESFDLVMSLFHVSSYMVTNEDILAFLKTIRNNLNNSGVALFDCWYGPGVLIDKPEVRINHFETEDAFVHKIKEPIMHVNNNIVDVKHHIYIEDKKTKNLQYYTETHSLRYFFFPEIIQLLQQSGLELVRWGLLGNGLTELPESNSWEACFMVKRNN